MQNSSVEANAPFDSIQGAFDTLKNSWDKLQKSEKARLVQQLVDIEGWKRNPLADALGCHHSVVTNLYNVGRTFSDEALDKLDRGQMSWKSAKQAARSAVKPETDAPADAAPESGAIESQVWEKDSRTLELKNTPIHTLDGMLDYFKVDTSEWEVDKFTVNRWESMAAQKATSIVLENKKGKKYIGWERQQTKIIVQPLYQIKAILKKKIQLTTFKVELEAMKEEYKAFSPVYARIHQPEILLHKAPGNLLVVNIPDVHMGKLAWSEETMYGNYDTGIAQRCFDAALEYLIEHTSSFLFDSVVFVVGNDSMQVDNKESTTTAGTRVDTDSRYQKVFRATRNMYTRAVEKVRLVAPVKVLLVPGNHDTLTTWHMGDSLECQFHNCPDVEINNAPTYRKYLQHGEVMLMWTHGNKGKLSDYPLLMASEQPKMWGSTKFREAHTGDKHHTRLDEFKGVKVRILPALCPPDAWHSENLFVGSLRSAEAYVYNSDSGLAQISVFTISDETAYEA